MKAFLGIGSNLENREANLHEAIHHFSVEQCSSIYETEPVGLVEQPWFLNAVISIRTAISPKHLLLDCQRLEKKLGRVRRIPKGPRLIDIDILFYENLVIHEPELVIPHPEIQNRRFVLEPLHEIAPDMIHPALQKTIAMLLDECTDTSTVRRWPR